MDTDVYEQIAQHLADLPNGFPRVPSGIEVELLRRIFAPGEARVVSALRREPQAAAAVAATLGLDESETLRLLKELARQEMVWPARTPSGLGFRLAPFVVGVFEGHMWKMDKAFAALFEQYLAEGAARSLMGRQPALQRVVPAQGSVEPEWVLPYDDVKKLLEAAKGFAVRDCVCRHERNLLGKACAAPVHTCLSFSALDRPPLQNIVSKDEALALLDRCEEIGLVHTVMNTKGAGYVCNCCGCCCALLRAINEYDAHGGVARANYNAEIDRDACTACGLCLDRCQVAAIADMGDYCAVNEARCIGCGLCVTGCPSQAARLRPLPAAKLIHPPDTFAEWEEMRMGAGAGKVLGVIVDFDDVAVRGQ